MEETQRTHPSVQDDYYRLSLKKRYAHIGLIVIVLIVLACGGWYFFGTKQSASQTPSVTPSPTQSIPSGTPSVAPHKQNGNTITGTVTTVTANSITIETLKRGTWTVIIDAATAITGKKDATMQLSDIQVQDRLRISGTIDKKTKTITATTIKDLGASLVPTPTLSQ